jgi:Gpi18-like mannosyltransferase
MKRPLWAILAAGFVLRLLFIGSNGFHNDVAAFETWAMTLRDHPPWMFYATAPFADYPPGYFLVLWIIGHLYALCPGMNADAATGRPLLRALVKLPAILMDLVNAAVLFAIVRRYAVQRVALIAAAFLAFNPAAIYVSAYWGQVDSVSWGLVLLALSLVLRAGDDTSRTASRLTLAWVVFACSLLIKPQAATFAALLLVYPFAAIDVAVRRVRLIGTAAGLAASLVLAWLVTSLFHGSLNPVEDYAWLLQRYAFGSNIYAFTSVNAFNLYAISSPFWLPDTTMLHVALPFGRGFDAGTRAACGVVLVLAATVMVAARYLQRKDDRSLIEGTLLVALAFFCLATRMHERYIYGAFLLAMPRIAFGRAGLWPSMVLTVTMFMNLAYSLSYQSVMENHTAGVDATNLWPVVSNLASLANVLMFFVLGYLYLGGTVPRFAQSRVNTFGRRTTTSARQWFDAREGLAGMSRRDWAIATGFAAVAFAIAIIHISLPTEKVFDEVYYPRSAVEYLKGLPQFEWTHPPFVKLVIAVSIAFFGDTSFGWRCLNVAIGALEVGICYGFAKRMTGSTVFASLGALMLTFDGFHFSEQRISTGEITIATLILIVLYALYRYVLSTQVAVRARIAERDRLVALTMIPAVPLALGFSWIANLQPPYHPLNAEIANGITNTAGADFTSYAVAFAYALLGLYLAARAGVQRFGKRIGSRIAYADGSYVDVDRSGAVVARYVSDTARSTQTRMRADGSYSYTTPAATTAFDPSGTMTVDGATIRAAHAGRWLALLVVALGVLVASKWNGFFDLALVIFVVIAISAQRLRTRAALWGNPRGFSLDIVLGLCLFVPATVYAITYIPTLLLGSGHSLADIIALQQQMYWYHSHLTDQTHPYRSTWWQWPVMQIPIVYYWHDSRVGAAAMNAAACCVAQIIALPNPLVFLMGLISVPLTGWLAWRERNKAYALIVFAYVFQWVPWMHSPREMFEYHFFPNLAIIVLCDVAALAWIYRRCTNLRRANVALGSYAAAVIGLFVYFYPVLTAAPMTSASWHDRMWPDVWGIPHTSWIMPPR